MSDQLVLNMIGKSYFRVYEATPEFFEASTSCYYVGETTKTHEEIQQLGKQNSSPDHLRHATNSAVGQKHMLSHPRYHLIDSNCQHLVEDLVKDLCDGAHVSQAKLSEELSLVSPKIAMDLVVARFRSKIDVMHEHEDSETVKQDADIIKKLWHKTHHR